MVYRIGDNPDEIYFIESGKVNFSNQRGDLIVQLTHGSYFGEVEMFDQTRRQYYAIADQASTLYFCKKNEFLLLLKEFPQIDEEVQEIVKRKKNKYKICEQLIGVQHKNGASNHQSVIYQNLQETSSYLVNQLIYYKQKILLQEKKKKLKSSSSDKDRSKPRHSSILLFFQKQRIISELRQNLQLKSSSAKGKMQLSGHEKKVLEEDAAKGEPAGDRPNGENKPNEMSDQGSDSSVSVDDDQNENDLNCSADEEEIHFDDSKRVSGDLRMASLQNSDGR